MKILGFEITRAKATTGPSLTNLYPVASGGVLGWVAEASTGDWQRGITTEPLASLASFGAVFSSASRIASDVAKLDLGLLTNVLMNAEGANATHQISVRVPESSPFWVPIVKPNPYQNRVQFYFHWLLSKLFYGNTYAFKQREEARGLVKELHILDPRRCFPLVTPEGDVYYSLGASDLAAIGQQGVVVPASEIIHDRGPTLWHPLCGVSPLYACAISSSQGLKMQKNSSKFFQNMSRPSGILTSPHAIKAETAVRLKKEWEENYSGTNFGRIAIADNGLEYKSIAMPPEQAQLIQQLGWTVEDVARAFAMPLYKINAGTLPNSSNVEALQIQYYTDCLQIYIEAIEACLTEGLELKAGYRVEFDLTGLLRMDSASQIEMLGKAVTTAQSTPNEARQKRNLEPKVGGDEVYLQQQNFSLAALAKRDAKDDPFGSSKTTPAPMPETAKGIEVDAEPLQEAFEGAVTRASEVLGQQVKSFLDRFLEDQEKRVSELIDKAREDQIRESVRIESVTGQLREELKASLERSKASTEAVDDDTLLRELGNEVAALFAEEFGE